MLKLLTRSNCDACTKVKNFATENNIPLEYILDEPNPYARTFPTLVTDWGFLANSNLIIEHLKRMKW